MISSEKLIGNQNARKKGAFTVHLCKGKKGDLIFIDKRWKVNWRHFGNLIEWLERYKELPLAPSPKIK